MAAIYWVDFDDGSMVSVNSADTKSFKKSDVRASYRKAVAKAKAKLAKQKGVKRLACKVVNARCVG